MRLMLDLHFISASVSFRRVETDVDTNTHKGSAIPGATLQLQSMEQSW